MTESENKLWMSVSDLMTGLMMVFLFISVAFMEEVYKEKRAVEKIALTYEDYQSDLHNSLIEEFNKDLARWDAGILADGTVRFYEPEVLFDQGSATIKPRFQEILGEFFPRYVALLASEKYRENIEEVRIEGHTSSSWEQSASLEERYLRNALLSQQRSFSILDFCFKMSQVVDYQPWLTRVLRANGLAFAKPVVLNGAEDESRSRRVEFRVRTKAEERINEIIRTVSDTQGEARAELKRGE